MQILLLKLISAYLVESGFNKMVDFLPNQIIRLDIIDREDLCVALTHLKPHIKKIAATH